VARLVTVRRPEEIAQQAHEYVKSYILFPSGLVGLICLIGGVGGLGYQLIASATYTWDTFYQSSALIMLGLLIGVAQTRYHQFLLTRFPEVFAARLRMASMKRGAKAKKEPHGLTIHHAGRQFVPLAYLSGAALLIGSALAASIYGQVSTVPALLMPWAGFYWARLFLWRKVVK
jgi:hypothetical protein